MLDDSYKDPEYSKYKFRELKVYSSTEWLADNKKKYRQVFDRDDTSYVYAELSFYNKLFDVEDWEVNVELKCYSLKKSRKLICNLSFQRTVSKYDNIVFIREGWGNKKEGGFWKKGTYYWEVWVESEKLGTKYFYMEDAMKNADADTNPFLSVKSLRLYEGPYDDVPEGDRAYLKRFNCEETRYVYLEIILKNLHYGKPWHCELFTKFFNDSKELKGQVVRLQRIEKKEETITITAGWGSNIKGSWRKDKYTVQLIFMDRLLAIIPFEVGEEDEVGFPHVYLPNQMAPVILTEDYDDTKSFDEVMLSLNNLIGLKTIKKKVLEHAKYIQFLQLRKDKGFNEKEEINVHSVFIGNPGTGKTTVAGMMGRLYKKMGLLSKGHVHEVDRVDLVGEYIGQTAPKVKAAIKKARGGVLFIDEAYSLARANDDSKDFGREVIEILVKEMSNGPGDMAVIVAGYPKEMKHFLDSNPGLKSRFKLHFEFEDYLPQELSHISTYACLEKGILLAPDAKERIDEIIVEAFRSRDRSFGNARFVYDLIEQGKINLGLRVMDYENPMALSLEEISLVKMSDVENIKLKPSREKPDIPVDKRLLEEALSELNKLIGMENIKRQIEELVKLVVFYKETGKNVLNSFYLHTVFIGNPGTGKTTVARILTRIYKALGMLERGHIVETDRQGLVAPFIGQTAIKTAEKVEEALKGVLFIDEAYSLTQAGPSHQGDFGNEAIQTLLKRMEDFRGEFFVFVAGYTDNMEAFLKANPGLNSRFDKILKFNDYSPAELTEISVQMLEEQEVSISAEALKHLEKYFGYLHDHRDKYFGNARTVRTVITQAIQNMNLRLSETPVENRSENVSCIELADVKGYKLDKSTFVFNKKSIGFRKPSENR